MVALRQIKSISRANKMREALISESLIKAMFAPCCVMNSSIDLLHRDPLVLSEQTFASYLKEALPNTACLCISYIAIISSTLAISQSVMSVRFYISVEPCVVSPQGIKLFAKNSKIKYNR